LSDRGGADTCLISTLDALAAVWEQHLVVDRMDPECSVPCPVTRVAGLAARTRQNAERGLDAALTAIQPDVIHIHNVVNPDVLEWGVRHGAVLSVQDHRFFCPGRGKWTLSGDICRDGMSRDLCAACFDDDVYAKDIYSLTSCRLAAAQQMHVTVLSRYMREQLLQAGVASSRVSVVPPFVHGLEASEVPREPAFVLFAGRLVEAKGVREALAAWRESRSSLPLVIAGAGPLRPLLESETGVHCIGWVPRSRLASLYRGAAALVMPSRWQEPFGLVGLEALHMGTSVAAWASGGVEEWHPGPGLAEWGSVNELARALDRVLGKPASVPRRFSREATVEALTQVYARAFRDS
jgi:glycosyltransferase involved in cell wall biosynthesis